MQTTEHRRARGWTDGASTMFGWLLDHVPAPPEGWLGFCFRTWLAMVLALSAAFWLQLSSASSAAVCVAILAQPTRGQAASKAIYRMGGTLLGGVVALALQHLFPQDRFMLLGGFALWIAVCTFVGSMLRDFRAYAAVLSGYTVAIVAVSNIDTPLQTFDSATSRVAAIALGIVATMLVNDVFGSPDTWTRLSKSLGDLAERTFRIGDDALAGRPIPSQSELSSLTSQIVGLRSQASYAKTELQDGRRRIAAAASAILGLLDMLRCARALAHAPDRHPADDTPTALYIEDRTAALSRHRGFAEDGMRVLADGGMPSRTVRLGVHHDYFAGGLNTIRTLIAVMFGAAFSILSGFSDSTLALVQVAAICSLAATTPSPSSFAVGTLVGAPLGIIAAGLTQYLLLNHGSAMPLLAIALLPTILIACSLSMNQKTGPIGTNMLLYTIIVLSPANTQDFDPTTFAETSTMLMASAVIVYLSLVLVLPVSPRRRLLRNFVSISEELRDTLDGKPLGGTHNVSRRYDRLSQIVTWNKQIGETSSRRFVLARAVGLTDLIEAMSRARVALVRARAVPALREAAIEAERALHEAARDAGDMVAQAARRLAEQGEGLAPIEETIMHRAVSGLHGADRLLQSNRRMLVLTGVIGDGR